MQPIGHEGGGGIAQRGRSPISTIALLLHVNSCDKELPRRNCLLGETPSRFDFVPLQLFYFAQNPQFISNTGRSVPNTRLSHNNDVTRPASIVINQAFHRLPVTLQTSPNVSKSNRERHLAGSSP